MVTARTGRGRAVAIAASIAVHGVALILLAVSATPALRLPTTPFAPDVTLYLERPPRRLQEQARSDAAPRLASAAIEANPFAPATRAARPRPAVAPPPTSSLPTVGPTVSAPASAAPAIAAVQHPQPGSSPAGAGRGWQVQPGAGDIHGLSRGFAGCDRGGHGGLTTAEQAACDRKYAGMRSAEAPHVDLIPAEKRAYYDSVAAAYAKVHAGGGVPGRMPVGPAAPTLLADRGGGLYIPGVGCGIKFGIPLGWKSYHDRPPHSLKLGALPCFIAPPQALGTEESGVQAPASLRERTDDAAQLKKLEAPPSR